MPRATFIGRKNFPKNSAAWNFSLEIGRFKSREILSISLILKKEIKIRFCEQIEARISTLGLQK